MPPGFRLDLWSAPAPAGGTRTAFLVDPAVGRSVTDIQRTRSIEPGQSQLTFRVAPSHPHLALLQPQQGVVRVTRFVPTGPDSYGERWEEWRIVQRRRPVEREARVLEIVCVPLEEDLSDVDLHREVTGGGLSQWRFGVTDRTPTQVLQLLRDRLVAVGLSWIDVGTVTPTQAVTFALEQAATPRAVTQALVDALAAQGIEAEFQCVRANDDSKYLLELVTRVAGSLAPLVATTDAAAVELLVSEDASEQANVVVPFGDDGIDLRELQVEVQAVDAGTGWVTLRAIGATPADVIAVDDQWNGQRLFRELTGRSFAILDSSASPMRVQLAVADLASGLAVGERVSFRASEDLAGTRRAFVTRAARSPLEVVSTLTGPPRINTRDLYGAGASIAAAHQYRDWTAERSTLVATMPETTFDPAAGTAVFTSAPSAAPQVGDWLWSNALDGVAPLTVTGYNAGTRTATVVARYGGHPYTVAAVYAAATVRCYRPVASAAFWIQASQVSGGQLQVDAFTGGTPAAGDVLELVQRHQGVRVVEVTDPAAIAATRRRVATLEVPCTGATNRLANADLSAWTGGSGDPPDGWTIASIVGTVTRARVTAATLTRYGGKAWQLAFAPGASAELFSPLVPAHAVPGLEQVSGALALLFPQFTGNIPVEVTLYRVSAGGTRTALADAIRIFPPDTTAIVDDSFRAALDTWYDAVLTNIGIADLGDESLQFGLRRPAGASNPACTVVLDAAMLLHREGLPQAAEGGVRYVFGSDATPMLSAAQRILLDRARPLVSFSGRFLDLYRTDALRYAPFELVPGRDVELRVPALGLQRTVRLIATREDPDDPRTAQVTLDRVRPDVGRLLAGKLFPVPPSSLPAGTVTVGGLPYATATLARVSSTASTVVIQGSASCPGRTPPQVRIASISGGATIAAGPSVGTAAPSGQGWTINRPPASGGGPALVILETVGTGFVGDVALLVIEEQGIELVPLQMRARVLSSDATQVVVRVAVADPLPQGTGSVTVAYQEAGVSGTSPATGQTLTPQATLSEAAGTYVDFTIPRPSAGGPLGRVTFTATAADRLAAIDAQDVPPAGLVYAQCEAKVSAISPTELQVTVTASAAAGTPQVKLVSIAGTAAKTAGANAGTLVASGSVWTFSRGAFGDGPSQLVFAAEAAGLVSDLDMVEVPERVRDTVPLHARARVLSADATQIVVRVAVADPFPQGAGSATIAYSATGLTGISPASGQTVTPAATITEAAGTYVDFTVPRPSAGAGIGRIVFTVSAADRVADSDALDVPPAGLVYAQCEAQLTSITPTEVTVTVTGASSLGTPQVKLVSIGGTAVKTAGANAGTLVASGSVWTFSRGAFGDGPSQLVFAAEGAGLIADTDLVEVSEQMRDTVGLEVRARVTATTETDVTVRVAVADPFPQGAGSATIAYSATGLSGISPASGQAVTPASTITEGANTYVDFTVPRPVAGAPVGRVVFSATAANRTADSDAIDVPARSEAHLSLVVSFATDGSAVLSITGSPSVASIRYAVSTSATPSLGTVQAASPTDGRNLTVSLPGPYALGQTLYVSALAYSAVSGGGQEFGPFNVRDTRPNVAGSKTNRLAALAILRPVADHVTYAIVDGYYRTQQFSEHGGFIPVPKGATLTAVRARVWVKDAGGTFNDYCRFALYRVGQDGARTQIGSFADSGVNDAWTTVTVSSLSEDTSGDRSYYVWFSFLTDGASPENRVAWIEYDYDYPDLTVNT